MNRNTDGIAGKTALVTGAAKRIGRAVALELAQHGANVVVHYHRSSVAAEDTAHEIETVGARAWTLCADQSDVTQMESTVARAIAMAGPLDFLVNSASVFPEDTLLDVSLDKLHTVTAVNAYAPLVLSRAFAAQGRDGSIVNLLDARMDDYDRSHVSYQLSKRMLETMGRMMAEDFAPRIRVNAVAPGLVLPPEGKDDAYLQALAHTNPLNRVGALNDVTDAVLFLLRSEFVTGQVIYIDGGRHMRTSIHA